MEKEESVLRPVKRTSLSDTIMENLRNAILNGEIGLGERINETAFTTQWGISRSTLREAMRQLEQAGLLNRIPYHGTFVRRFDEAEIKDLNQMRGVLEAYAAELIMEKKDRCEEVAEMLGGIVSQMEGIDPQKDAAKTNALHIRFHRTLVGETGNTLLLKVWNEMEQQFWIAMRVSQLSLLTGGGDAEDFTQAHRKIADVIAAGDAEQARLLIRRHVSR